VPRPPKRRILTASGQVRRSREWRQRFSLTEAGQARIDADRAKAGAAVVYATHYLPELAELHATVAVAQAGRSLGIDNLLAKRLIPGLSYDGAVTRAISVAT